MSVSETNTPASTSTSARATGNETDLELSGKIFEILEKEEINGRDFLKVTEEKLRSVGLGLGPATSLRISPRSVGRKSCGPFPRTLV
ncbi:hypothetical protein RhiirA1_450394 [Rhizophagus irregularis]|uniref:SAM domain-containing protein n=1 Tax=Rhizophagus irregularis TaxID=588596 RepID=A0A2N0SEV1_9GLOM|nr:hypothetical protein RhiirA1_450394 [Rhizophagus irregularis]